MIGGGFPLAAIAGRADIMKHFDKAAVPEDEFLVQIGTLSGNPVAAAAGLATMEILKRPGAYETALGHRQHVDGCARPPPEGGAHPAPDRRRGADVRCRLHARSESPTIAATSKAMPSWRRRSTPLCSGNGILKSDSKYYISIAHDDRDVAQTIAAWEVAVREIKATKAT